MLSPKRRIALIGMPIIPNAEENLFNGFLRYATERKSWDYIFSAEGTVDSLRFLSKIKCDGALVRLLTPEMVHIAKQTQVPMVNVSTWLPPMPGIPTVCRDDALIGQLAAEHLMQNGFQRFACVVCPGGWYAQARADGFRNTVERAGFSCNTHHIETHLQQISQPQEMSKLDLRNLESWLIKLPPQVGLFWTEDHLSKQLLLSCQRVGVSVPQQIAIVSAPNRASYCESCDPPLSSINSPEDQIGYVAAHWLDRLMQGETMDQSPHTISPSGVVIRKSSDTFAADDPLVARSVQYIYEHLAEGINASEVVNALDLPRRTFYRAFRATTGQTPQRFIQDRRIRIALDLLAKKKALSLQDIAYQCGFRDRDQMNLTIAKATGKTPQAWQMET